MRGGDGGEEGEEGAVDACFAVDEGAVDVEDYCFELG